MDTMLKETMISILREELIPAMGCTEPIALAYAAAKAKEVLGEEPESIRAICSGNMIKNVRCVKIPNSGGMIGIEAACVLGAVGGKVEANMEVLESVTDYDRLKTVEMLKAKVCTVEYLESDIPLHFIVEMKGKEHDCSIEVRYSHLNVTEIKKDGEVLFSNPEEAALHANQTDRSCLTIANIKEFADKIDVDEIRDIYDHQIRCNMDIAYEGMAGDYGVGIGRMIMRNYPESVLTRMKAYAAAASEARMGGCDLPVVINSGSGNQGIASSVPIIVYARENHLTREEMIKALAFSSLLTTLQKTYIGKLSAFCGAVSASTSAGAAITYIAGGTLDQIKATIDNTLANIPGIICDGAKISCGAKIASCIDATMMAHYLAMNNDRYDAYTGIIKEDAGETIACVGHIGRVGMRQTDQEIIKLMLK